MDTMRKDFARQLNGFSFYSFSQCFFGDYFRTGFWRAAKKCFPLVSQDRGSDLKPVLRAGV
ncbi:hypothetical protein [Syntrophobotulus glycolicus]|uniref:hypothetical protein n=1 Tax=Syntrophobotulus glycolicus TaxID=51197 RepID=UPI0011D160E1|nr:hypothetical protein [Syntrophobotulus glycolicus]